MTRALWIIGCALAFLSVAGGAFGAHGLRDAITPERLDTWITGARYAMSHALAILVAAGLYAWMPGRAALVAGGLFTLGVLLFTGSLWTLVLTDQRWLGAVAPLGGLSFLAGWVALAMAGWWCLAPSA